MVILHIASINENLFNGVCVVVPQHIMHQKNVADVGFINVRNIKIEGIDNQIEYNTNFDIENLPEPFSKPDIVVFHEVYRPKFLKISKNLVKKGIPYVIIPHGSLTREVQRQNRLKKIAGNIFLFNRFIKNACGIQCLSEHERERVDFKVKTFVGTNGIRVPEKSKMLFNEDGVNINYIGRLEMYTKGLDLMAEAVAIKADFLRKNNCKINIYGPDILGRKQALQELICKLKIQDILILNDAVTGEQKEELLLNTDLFIQTSRTEAMPMGILEALSYGIPCVVTEGTNFGELILSCDAGWVAENNAESVAEKLILAIKQKESWQEKSRNARFLVNENFAWKVIVEKTIEEYSRLNSCQRK